jgi:hypothetical protein
MKKKTPPPTTTTTTIREQTIINHILNLLTLTWFG